MVATGTYAHGLKRYLEDELGAPLLDIDLILVGKRSLDTERLVLPHPRAQERAFVLVPWQEVDPGAELPGVGVIDELLEQVDTSGVRRSDETVELP